MKQRLLISVGIFSAAGFLGPAIRLVSPGPEVVGTTLRLLLSDLVIILWPSFILTAATGDSVMLWLIVAVAPNVILYGVIGLVVGLMLVRAGSDRRLLFAYGGIACLFLLWRLAIFEWQLSSFNFGGFLVAMVLIAVPFILVRKFLRPLH